MNEDMEHTKASRLARINVERKELNDILRSKKCSVFCDKRSKNKYSKQEIEDMLYDYWEDE